MPLTKQKFIITINSLKLFLKNCMLYLIPNTTLASDRKKKKV